MDQIPSFDSLPLRKGDPPYSAWGLYGRHDQLGTLNRLTPGVVLEAAKEIKTGVRVSLNWPLDAQATPGFGRQAFELKILPKSHAIVHDDVWTLNPQSSSQWDGLRHYAYQKSGLFYNGVTRDNILKPGNPTEPRLAGVNGVHFWADKGIVGRGVLLDHLAWRQHIVATQPNSTDAARLRDFDTSKSCPITLADLKAVAEHQQLTFKPADILLVRTGYIHDYGRKSSEPAVVGARPLGTYTGLERGEHMLRWIWENFAAVAGDQPAWEVWPAKRGELMLHEVLLSGWGCPIGELFDLEKLSRECRRHGRWSFFMTSEPCNVRGACATPPNALAIF